MRIWNGGSNQLNARKDNLNTTKAIRKAFVRPVHLDCKLEWRKVEGTNATISNEFKLTIKSTTTKNRFMCLD